MRRISLAAAVMFSLAMFVASCGSNKNSSPTSPSAPTQTSPAHATTAPAPPDPNPAIVIANGGQGFMFTTSGVKAGATITAKNNTVVQHTVSADTTAGGFDVTVDPGKTATFKAPSTPGAYTFHCNIHTYMTGTLTVT